MRSKRCFKKVELIFVIIKVMLNNKGFTRALFWMAILLCFLEWLYYFLFMRMELEVWKPNILQLQKENGVPQYPVTLNDIIFLYTADLHLLDSLLTNLQQWTDYGRYSINCQVSLTIKEQQHVNFFRKRLEENGHNCNVIVLPDPHFTIRWAKSVYHIKPYTHKWAMILDLDSMILVPNLLNFLSTQNPKKRTLFGALVDNAVSFHDLGIMAYGGGGVIISTSLIAFIQNEGVHKLTQHLDFPSGDGIFSALMKDLNVPLSAVSTLNQMDISKDISGFIEGGKLSSDTITFHHYCIFFNLLIYLFFSMVEFWSI